MAQIELLDAGTINKIAAGEVVERPLSVVKELVENAMDAGADAITVEIKEGGIAFIRVTDNGTGIESGQVRKAFLRHATSKISSEEDLFGVKSLGFRGEALSSIASVAKVELITKTRDALVGVRYVCEGTREMEFSDVGAPDGTTIIVRNLFFNTPVRRRFLKQPVTEGNYVVDLMEHMALSRQDISFKLVVNGQVRFHTSGNGDLREVIYRIYGREMAAENVISVEGEGEGMRLSGYLGKPVINRANRNFEIYFINNRYIKSDILYKAIEEGYAPFLMQHKFPFAVLQLCMDPGLVDVNVHPTKMDVRFSEPDAVYRFLCETIADRLKREEMIPQVSLPEPPQSPPITEKPVEKAVSPKLSVPEPFETIRSEQFFLKEAAEYVPQQLELFEERFLEKAHRQEYEILGQVFDTYWVVAFHDKLYFIDQHAAHEKVKYERLVKQFHEKRIMTQSVNPPVIVTLTAAERQVFDSCQEMFSNLGFEIEPFGGTEYAIRGVPTDLYGCRERELFTEVLDELSEGPALKGFTVIEEKLASMACKAAVKGNHSLSRKEAEELIDELLTLENPYHCPHGRPTIIAMSKNEMEKKFKRIL